MVCVVVVNVTWVHSPGCGLVKVVRTVLTATLLVLPHNSPLSISLEPVDSALIDADIHVCILKLTPKYYLLFIITI